MEEVIWFAIDMFRFLAGSILVLVSTMVFVTIPFSSEHPLIKLVVMVVCAVVYLYGYRLMPEGYDV